MTSAQGGARDAKLGFMPVLAFAIGAMVGGGVFTLSGRAVNEAGPGALGSYAVAGLIMLVSALGFVAVAARAEEGDSGYGPVADLLGRRARFLVMWGFSVHQAVRPLLLHPGAPPRYVDCSDRNSDRRGGLLMYNMDRRVRL